MVAALIVVGTVAAGIFGQLAHRGKATAVPSPPAQRSAPASGVYVGPGDAVAVVNFGRWRKVSAAFAVDYIPATDWQAISAPTWLLGQWEGSGLPLVLAVPMLPDHGSATIAEGAQGKYDHYFRTLAQHLLRYDAASASLRIGWEMNGGWYSWSAAHDPATWIAYYRRIVSVMRSVPGTRFNFVWNPNVGSPSLDPAAAYPGDAFVDEIGMDVYDWRWNAPWANPQSRWEWLVNEPGGLSWLAAFGAEHNKPISLPEWSLALPEENTNGGGGDDPYFVRELLDWASTHGVVSEAYFDYDTHRLANFPTAEREYLRVERELDDLRAAG